MRERELDLARSGDRHGQSADVKVADVKNTNWSTAPASAITELDAASDRGLAGAGHTLTPYRAAIGTIMSFMVDFSTQISTT